MSQMCIYIDNDVRIFSYKAQVSYIFGNNDNCPNILYT